MSTTTNEAPLVWGAGAIGGTVAAYLDRAGHKPVCVDVVAEHVLAINQSGLRITGPVEEFTARPVAHGPESLEGQFRTVFLAVKAHHTAAAARMVEPHLAPDGHVVSLQNGLNELTIAEVVGRRRTVGAFINFSADYHGPGHILYGSRGAVVVGELDGAMTPRLRAVHGLLSDFDDRATLSENIFGVLWGKLVYGSFLKAIALTDASIVEGLANPAYRDLYVAMAREILAAADSQGIRAEGFNGFEPDAFRAGADPAALERTFEAMIVFNGASAKTHSGIWRDLAVRKRQTDVAAQLAPMLAAGASTPIVSRLVALITDIEQGRRPQDWSTLDTLKEAAGASTRSATQAGHLRRRSGLTDKDKPVGP